MAGTQSFAAQPVATSAAVADAALQSLGRIILGKDQELRLCLTCLIAGGHLLIEDVPGVGKTTLAHALARVLGLSHQRIQFTSDLLPADVLGVSIYNRESGGFEFHHGPIFAQLILADEVNRATPKTQSALLEAMEERQVTADGKTRPLPDPFFVVATQNPSEQVGTFALPESQLDRFLLSLSLGYPSPSLERELIAGTDRRELLAEMTAALDNDALARLQADAPKVHVSDALLDYLQALVAFTRQSPELVAGLSPRAAIAMRRAAQAWALIHGHRGVLPEDVQAVLPGIVRHRLQARNASSAMSGDEIAQHILKSVAIP